VGNTKSSKAGLTNFAYCKTIKTVPRDCKYSGLKKQQEACSFDKAAVVVVWMLHYNTQIQKGKGTPIMRIAKFALEFLELHSRNKVKQSDKP
jgi:hypothetical protein